MYLDGVGYERKSSQSEGVAGPRSREWRKRSQGLYMNQTAKGKKEGKNNAYFYFGISQNRRVVTCKAYTGRMNTEKYHTNIHPSK